VTLDLTRPPRQDASVGQGQDLNMEGIGEAYFDSLKKYVGFDAESSALLRQVHPIVAPHVPRIIDDFYATIEAHPGARGAITGGQAQIERLKGSLRRWLEELFLGPHDAGYIARRARIGRIHVRISLPQAFMFTAMNRIRVQVAAVIHQDPSFDAAALVCTTRAVHQIMDLELAIMLETYREDLVAKNRSAERLATIGQFAASIGHELRNPLGVVESSAFLLRQLLSKGTIDPKVDRHLEKITAEVKRSNKTIHELLELARSKPPNRRVVPVRAVVDGALAAAALPKGVTVTANVPEGAQADLDPDQITRVLTNLLINASQAMDGRGEIWIDAGGDGKETRLRVRDSGPGVPGDVRHRLFEALFTTKAKGSGLGLALCRRIAEAHGGSIVLESGEGGATFLLTIPAQEPNP
jgi:two-component system sensor histidine kinase HydH